MEARLYIYSRESVCIPTWVKYVVENIQSKGDGDKAGNENEGEKSEVKAVKQTVNQGKQRVLYRMANSHIPIPMIIMLFAMIIIGMYIGASVGTELGVMAGAQEYIAGGSEAIVLNATHNPGLADSALKEGSAEAASTISAWTVLGAGIGGAAGLVAGIELIMILERARKTLYGVGE
ncbi:MAG: hypothetical protein [aquatic viral metagenome]